MNPSTLHFAHITRRLRTLDAHIRFLAALGIGVLTVFLLPRTMLLQTRLVMGYDAGAVCLIAMAWTVMNFATPHAIHAGAWRQDTSRTVIFFTVLVCALAGLTAIFVMLGSVKADGVSHTTKVAHIAVSVLAVLCSWMMTHTTFALHYARRYYQDVVKRSHTEEAGGLSFQERGQPDYWDFAYFSFTIGMTSQTSDVSVTTRQMRRLTLLHGILSFFFNTAVLAMAINIVASVL